ncbi:MAG: hypothetical protein GQ577_13510 [Woeseiaceae bacterium]|nr:hypothetical protein [Woeseiaceae bacterium]
MARKRKQKLHGIAEPMLGRDPLFIRLCSVFVDNLALILRTALVTGALFLVQDLSDFYDRVADDSVEAETAQIAIENEPVPAEDIAVIEPVINDRILHAKNCTIAEYREAHYDNCVDEPSSVYPRPEADPDDIGYLADDSPVMFASLDN